MEWACVVIFALSGSFGPEEGFFLFPIFTEGEGLIDDVEEPLILMVKSQVLTNHFPVCVSLTNSDGLVESVSFSPNFDHWAEWNLYKNYI